MERPAQPDHLVAPGAPPAIAYDPELLAARETLITRMMNGPAWDRASSAHKVARLVTFVLLLLPAIPVVTGVLLCIFGAVHGIATDFDYGNGGEPTNDQMTAWLHRAFYTTLILAAAWFVGVMRRQLREPRRLRALSNVDFLREYQRWEQEMAALAAARERQRRHVMETLDRQRTDDDLARRIGEEHLRVGRQLEWERHTTIYPSR